MSTVFDSRIDVLTNRCGWCHRPLRSPSMHWCSEQCQREWTQSRNQTVPLPKNASTTEASEVRITNLETGHTYVMGPTRFHIEW